MKDTENVPSTYAEAGIDLAREEDILKTINQYVKKSFSLGEVAASEGHYANLIKLGNLGIGLTTDGVGTKILVAQKTKKYDTIGIDCVAMNVNDLLSMGILPKAFVDYLAVANQDKVQIEEILKGIYKGCEIASIPLLGGELATIPELLTKSDNAFDLAGTALGIIELDKIIDGSDINIGDAILGITSNGIHSNGFTIARKVLGVKYELSEELPWKRKLGEELLNPTRIYVKAIDELLQNVTVHGLAHITGGGFKKLFRITNLGFEINNFPEPHMIFQEIQKLGNISNQEMFSVFNMGVGFVVITPQQDKKKALKILSKHFETHELGLIIEDPVITITQFNVLFLR
jgi:phosphoribosylformylglycinamidine cyclo-ligase